MSCGLGIIEVYRSNIWNELLILEAFANQGLPAYLPQIGQKRKLPNGGCRKYGERGENRESDDGRRGPVPLHRSPAVLTALAAVMDHKNTTLQEADGENAFANSDLSPRTHAASQSLHSLSESAPLGISKTPAKHFPDCRKASSALNLRVTSRVRPYERPPVHVVLEKSRAEGLPSSSSWPDHLTDSDKPQQTHRIVKSFSSPDRLHLHGARSSAEISGVVGGQLNAYAIQNLSRVCMELPTAYPTTSSNISAQNATKAVAEQSTNSRITGSLKKADNFRKLMHLRADASAPILSSRDCALQRHIKDALATHGICVIDGLLGHDLATKMKEEVMKLHGGSGVVEGGLIGRGQNESDTRGDLITWVEGTEPSCPTIGLLCQKMDRVVSLGTGVAPAHTICGGTKAMVARYPGRGTRYKLHVDNATKDGRCLTCIYYLNKGWDQKTMGGTLRIHAQKSRKTANVAPLLDRLAVFYSDGRNPHEVLPCHTNRYAITLWYFDRDERTEALKRMDSSAPLTSPEHKEKPNAASPCANRELTDL